MRRGLREIPIKATPGKGNDVIEVINSFGHWLTYVTCNIVVIRKYFVVLINFKIFGTFLLNASWKPIGVFSNNFSLSEQSVWFINFLP